MKASRQIMTNRHRHYAGFEKYGEKSQSKEEHEYHMFVPGGFWFCFCHTLWFSILLTDLCCFPSQPLPLPCRRSKLVGLIAQGCPWSAWWSVRYWLLVFLKGRFPMLVQGFGNLVPFLQKPRFRWRNALLDLCRHEVLFLTYGEPLISFGAPMLTQRIVQCHDAGCS